MIIRGLIHEASDKKLIYENDLILLIPGDDSSYKAVKNDSLSQSTSSRCCLIKFSFHHFIK